MYSQGSSNCFPTGQSTMPPVSLLCKPTKLTLTEQLIQQLLPGLMLLLSRSNHLCRHLLQKLFCRGKGDRGPDNPGVLEKINRHGEWLSACFNDGDAGNLKVRNSGIEFLRNRWSTQIGNDEARQTGQ